MHNSRAIGIDLGTCYTRVAIWNRNHVDIIPDEQGNRFMPTCVSFSRDGRLTGEAAKNQLALNPYNTIYNIKRMLGRKYDDEDIKSDMKRYPFHCFSKNGTPYIQVEYRGELKIFAPEELLAITLMKIKETAEAHLKGPCAGAVVTVPSSFNSSQRQSLSDACEIAGLNQSRIIPETSAAAMYYTLYSENSGARNVIFFDLGGGVCNVSLLNLEESVVEVKACTGEIHLGGEDFDDRLVDHFVREFKDIHGEDLSAHPRSVLRLRTACERAKRVLSSATQALIEIDSLFNGINFSVVINRDQFETLCADLIRATLEPIKKVLQDAKIDKSNIHEIILVGGSSRIPAIKEQLSAFFQKSPVSIRNVDEAVAYGAAMQAAMLSGESSGKLIDLICLDAIPYSLGIATLSDNLLPLDGDITSDHVMFKPVSRNTISPTKKSEIFSTYFNNQTKVVIRVYEGEHERAISNNFLGCFELAIHPAPRGVPRILITFDIDASYNVIVSAQDQSSGNWSRLNVPISRFSDMEKDHMIQEAQRHKAMDEADKARIQAKHDFEAYCFRLRDELESEIEKSLQWLDDREEASVEEYEAKQQNLREFVRNLQ